MIIHGDCLEELKKLPENSVDSVVTDPPYGLSKEPNITEVLTKWIAGEDYEHKGNGFMSKKWDSFVPGPAIWKEVFRVLKPGGHLLCFAGTRTQDLMAISLRLAGFEIRDCISYLFFQGFPKSMNISKQIDKRKGGGMLVDEVCSYLRQKRDEKGLKNQDIDRLLGLTTGAFHYFAKSHSNSMIPPLNQYKRLKEILNLDDRYDELIEAAEREKIGEVKTKHLANNAQETFLGKGSTVVDITAPATELAKQWDGWGTQLKPSHEPIILARKPLEKTVAYNVEKWGVGGINIDGCRIGRTADDRFHYGISGDEPSAVTNGIYGAYNERIGYKPHETGRFPANCITTVDDAFFSKYFNITPAELSKKASKKDRNSDWKGEEITLESMQPVRFASENGSGQMLPSKKSGLESHIVKGNFHPTCKPTSLMAWLIRLITPPNGIVLDPFAGSGSTLVAAKREGFKYIGIEKEADYIEIIKARLKEDE